MNTMKNVIIIIFSIYFFSCASNTVVATEKTTDTTSTTISTTQTQPEILVGKQNRKALEQKPFDVWFTANY